MVATTGPEVGGRRQGVRLAGRAAVDALARDGSGRHLCLRGGPGFGKTTLASELIADARRHRLAVITGAATGFDAATPFAPLARLKLPNGESLFPPERFVTRQLDPGIVGRVPAVDADRFSVAESLVSTLEDRVAEATLLVIEDVHWADPATVDALLAIADITRSLPLLLLTTCRPQPDGFDHRAELGGATVLTLEPFDRADVAALVAELVGEDADAAALERAQQGQGNPLLVAELVGGLLIDADALAERGEGATAGEGTRVPPVLQGAVERRIGLMEPDTATVLRAASVLGLHVDVVTLGRTLDRSPLALQAPLAAGIEQGLLEERRDELWFRHDLIRVAVYESMLSSVRAATHQQVATILAQHGASPALVGTHLVLAGGLGDPDTVEKLQRAASEAAPFVPEAALTFLDRARELAGPDADARRVIERARLDALTSAGRLDEAEEVGNWLLRITPATDRPELQARLAGLAMLTGDGPRAMALLEQARADALDETVESPIVALAASTSLSIGDFELAGRLAAEAIEIGQRVDDPIAHSVGLSLTGRISTFGNAYDEGMRLGAASVAVADTDPTGVAHQYLPCLFYGLTCIDVDRLDLADAMVVQGRQMAAESGGTWSLPLYGALATVVDYRRGDLDAARAEAEVAIELAEHTGSRQAEVLALSVLALIELEYDEVAVARRWVDQATESFTSGKSRLGSDLLALARARVATMEGEPRDGLEELAFAWDLFVAAKTLLCLPGSALDFGSWAHEVGDRERLDVVVDAMREAADASGLASTRGLAGWLAALRDGDLGQAGRAIEVIRAAERPLDLAALLLETARRFPCPPAERSRLLDEARRLFEHCGARRSAAVADQLANGPVTAARAVDGWASLTPTELEIARALAAGLTNAQIAQQRGGSRRTVESHLGRIYRKLAIDGRVKLTVAATQYFRDN
ncbi:MAG: AAA family ATPase [Acidimicrobiales bacterium]|nr:AAA family ATPase [Acidimicrobiales bacterium]